VSFTEREWWGLIHGMGLGTLFLLAFAGGLAGLYSLRPELITAAGVSERMRRLRIGVVAMAVVAWLTVITGTWIVYPWYREDVPDSARSQLLADESS
jgi:glycerol uptake facilitator-like aquaporin